MIKFRKQSQQWCWGIVRMETLQSFAVQLQRNETLPYLDIKSGHRHLYLHPDMRNYFIFRYEGRHYRCIVLPFGWGRSVLCFTELLRPPVRHLREWLSYRMLPYIDDFLIGSVSTWPPIYTQGLCASERLDGVFARTGLTQHPDKGCWEGSQSLDHVGVHIDTRNMKLYVADRKVRRVRGFAKKILLLAQRNRCLISLRLLHNFCGVCASLAIALPLSRCYTRLLYLDISISMQESPGCASNN